MAKKPTSEALEQRIKELEKEIGHLKQAVDEKEMISTISQFFLTSEKLESIYKELPKILSTYFKFPFVALEIYDQPANEMILVGSEGIPAEDAKPMRVPVDQTISGTVATTGKAVVEIDAGRRSEYRFATLRALDFKTFLCVPMKRGGRVLGTLALADRCERPEISSLKDTIQVIGNLLMQEIERKQTEESHRESEERYRTAIEHSNDGVAIYREEKYLYVNQKFAEIFGYHCPEELVGKPGAIVVHPDDRKRVIETYRRRQRGETVPGLYEFKGIRKDGAAIDIEISATATTFRGEPVSLAYLRDISEQRRAKEALKESEERYRQIVEHAPSGIYEVDITTGKFITVNDIMCEYTGYTKEEFFSLTPLDLLSKDSIKHFLKRRRKLDAGEKIPETVEYKFKRKDGREFWVLLNVRHMHKDGIPVRATVVAHDITLLKQTEEALRESEEKYRILVENANEGICIVQDGVIKFPNPFMVAISGYSAEELIKTPFLNFIHPEDRDMVIERYTKRLKGENVPSTYAFKVISKAGDELWVQMNAVPITWDGRPAVLTFLHDITTQKKLETHLQQAQKLEAVGTLAGGIAHNFNNLLMSIMGNTSLMLLETKPDDPNYEKLKEIERAAKSGATLTNQFLGYARKGKYEVKPINLNPLIEETSNTFGMTKKEIRVHRELAADLSGIIADQGQIEQILLNIYVNAADAMSEGGDLFLKTMNVTDEDIRGKQYEPNQGDYVLLTITDTGVGMDKKTKERIFEPFFTTKEMGRGTGLGLASVYGIIKAHDGYIDVVSEKGKGTTFNIYFPASDKKIPKAAKTAGEVMKGSATILFVDDEPPVLDVGVQILKNLGYTVFAAGCGKEAIKVYKKNKGKIDLVILDMIMPEIGGGEVYDRLKEIDPNIKVLLSSGYSINGQAKEILKRGCDDFIQKPFHMSELSQKIREILDKESHVFPNT